MRRAFTLLELLVVITIMGILGMATVNGYWAMRRGMEERSVLENANQFIRTAYHRAQIDRQPVSVYFWNETLREETEDRVPIVVGKAVAIRRSGRLTGVQGARLYDEFGDLRFNRLVLDEDADLSGDDESEAAGSGKGAGVSLYRMRGDEGSQRMCSTISETTERVTVNEPRIFSSSQAQIETYAFVVRDFNGVDWKIGDAYGFEFADLQLPHGYIFGREWKRTVESPITGETMLRFKVSANNGNGAHGGKDGVDTILISALRPGASGGIEVHQLKNTASPTKSLRR